jgi:transcription antitermination factor NusA-like protein
MTKTLGMQYIQYMNFFNKCVGVRSKHCFSYNGTLIFVVMPKFVRQAVGENGNNIRMLSLRLRKRVKIIGAPNGVEEIERFISSIVYPIKFKKATIEGDELIINAPPQSRAALIGRNKFRLEELENILGEYFGVKKLKIM